MVGSLARWWPRGLAGFHFLVENDAKTANSPNNSPSLFTWSILDVLILSIQIVAYSLQFFDSFSGTTARLVSPVYQDLIVVKFGGGKLAFSPPLQFDYTYTRL